MFHKEGSFVSKGKKSKDNTPLKKSVRRQLRDDFLKLILPESCNDEVENIKERVDFIFLDSKSDVSIRKLKRKDANSNAGATIIYFRAPTPSSSENLKFWPYTKFSQVLMIEVDKILLPSLALLSIIPVGILQNMPTVIVPPLVSKYLCRGADCMRSGIISMSSSHNGWMVIRAQENLQPFAIGLVTNGTDQSTIGVGTKGVGVQVISCYGDEIYRCQFDKTAKLSDDGYMSEIGGGKYDDGDYGNVGFIEGKRVYGLTRQGAENGQSENDDATTEIHESVQNMEISTNGNSNDKTSRMENDESEPPTINDSKKKYENNESSIIDSESILLQAFHDACVNVSKTQIPMTSSEFFSQHIIPARKDGSFINLKDTRFKKLGVFLMEQAAKGIITLGASNGDPVAFLKSIDRSHIDLREAKLRKKAHDMKSSGNALSLTKGKKLALVKLYIIPKITAKLMALNENDVQAIEAKNIKRRGTGFLTVPECRSILNKYILENDLVDKFDPEMVKVDGPLCDTLFRKSKKELKNESLDKNTYKEVVTRKEINIKWLDKMEKAYAIVSMPGSVITTMKRGEPPKVTFVVEARQNRRKFITRVRGLEEYHINPETFASDVSKRFACSSSIEKDAAGREALRKGHVECVFQGNLIDELTSLLLGDEKLCSHGGCKNSDYALPKGIFHFDLKKGVPKSRRHM